MTDDHVPEILAEEILAKEPMEMWLRPMTAFQLTALVQLALRHPGVSPALRWTGEGFVRAVREYFADCPMVNDVIRRGDDPNEDR